MKNGSNKQIIRRFRGGEIIFKEKTDGNEMYIIQSGKVQIHRYAGEKKVILAVLGENEFFGEMALLTGRKRTASDRTQTVIYSKTAAGQMEVRYMRHYM